MNNKHIKYKGQIPAVNFAVALAAVLICSSLFSQVHKDFGQLSIQNYSPKEYKSHPQNWDIVQDQNGLMYFANNLGVLIYDGQNWDLVKTESESTVRSLDVSPGGMVYVGAANDFGYIKANKEGRLNYVSLRKL